MGRPSIRIGLEHLDGGTEMRRYTARARRAASAFGIAALAWAGPAVAQEVVVAAPRALSLEEALELAEATSEPVAMARAGILRAEGEKLRARSQYLPQIFGSVGYTRTLASEFSAVGDDDDDAGQPRPESCAFAPDPELPVGERLKAVEDALKCTVDRGPSFDFGSLFEDLPFGREHQFNLGVTASQTLFAGGRLLAQGRAAQAGLETARVALASARAQMVLDVAQAYYDAALAQRLLDISEATLAQSRTTLEQTRLARQVGNQAEFDLLRAQVAFENQQPVVIQRRAERDIATMRLKQLIDLPLDAGIMLTTDLVETEPDAVVRMASALVPVAADTSSLLRAPVRQAEEAVRAQEALLDVAQAQRLPTLTLSSNWGRVSYPVELGVPAWTDFRSNWTVGLALTMPIFTGWRIRADEKVAEATLTEARARLAQTREAAALDTRSTLEQLRAAESAFRASAGTVGQARKAYTIAELRYAEGISTQVELTDAQILLQQAQANRARAARDLQVARLRAALLPRLPLGGAQGGTTMGGAGVQPPVPQAAPQRGAATQTATMGSGF